MNRLRFFVALVFSILLVSSAYAEADYGNAIKVFRDSPVVQPYFKDSYGYAIFQLSEKAGLVLVVLTVKARYTGVAKFQEIPQ